MKTKYTLILMMVLLLTGCTKENSRDEVLLNKYETAYNELVENDKFMSNSEYYNLEVVVSEIENNNYRIDVILDQPNVAMYNVQMIMEVNSQGIEQYQEMIPSLGIVDDTQYNLIPNQVNKENNFYAGLILSAITDKPLGDVKIMISWSDYAGTKDFEEFISLPYSDKKQVQSRSFDDMFDSEDLEAEEPETDE